MKQKTLKTKVEPKADVIRLAEGRYQLSGELDFDTVPSMLERSVNQFAADSVQSIVVDLTGVQRANSAALGLMLEWMRLMQQQNRSIAFHGVSDKLLAIAQVSDLDTVLPITV